jgi:hypothetical protein
VGEGPTLDAYEDLGAKLAARRGQAYVDSGQYKSSDDLDELASQDFARIRPTTVRVGSNLPAAD